MAFIRAHMSPLPFTLPELTVDAWDRVNGRYQTHAARGPDAFDALDLKRMPAEFKCSLVRLLQMVESGSSWPSQLTLGLGHCLPKHQEAICVNEFRPIVVAHGLL